MEKPVPRAAGEFLPRRRNRRPILEKMMGDDQDVRLWPELRPVAAAVAAAIQADDAAALRAIVEGCGLAWLDPELPDRHKTGMPCAV